MAEIGTWDWVLLAIAAYLAITTLVRLMRNRRDSVLDDLIGRAELEKRRQALEQKAEERRKAIERLNQRVG